MEIPTVKRFRGRLGKRFITSSNLAFTRKIPVLACWLQVFTLFALHFAVCCVEALQMWLQGQLYESTSLCIPLRYVSLSCAVGTVARASHFALSIS